MSFRIRKFAFISLFLLAVIGLCQALDIGAWVGGPGKYPQPTKENVEAFQKLQNRKVDIISYFAVWKTNDWSSTKPYLDVAERNGSILLVTWMANGFTAQDILAGKADAYIKAYARGIKKDGRTIWLRPLHEANGDWYDWGIGKRGARNTENGLINAWRHIVTIFRDMDVPNVRWVWTTTNDLPTGTSFLGTYPGDEWVDILSIDGYNWGTSQDWSSWRSFDDAFSASYEALSAIDKPLFIAEVGSTERGGNKAAWIKDMFETLPVKYPKVFAILWFNQSKSWEADWALDSSESSIAAWAECVAKLPKHGEENEIDAE
ncbi:MAG TPA: glycosyl hydrolase [Treponemataceae bacterium]|nr:glycosyl hydrolase [Treponemataceae bacterium]